MNSVEARITFAGILSSTSPLLPPMSSYNLWPHGCA